MSFTQTSFTLFSQCCPNETAAVHCPEHPLTPVPSSSPYSHQRPPLLLRALVAHERRPGSGIPPPSSRPKTAETAFSEARCITSRPARRGVEAPSGRDQRQATDGPRRRHLAPGYIHPPPKMRKRAAVGRRRSYTKGPRIMHSSAALHGEFIMAALQRAHPLRRPSFWGRTYGVSQSLRSQGRRGTHPTRGPRRARSGTRQRPPSPLLSLVVLVAADALAIHHS